MPHTSARVHNRSFMSRSTCDRQEHSAVLKGHERRAARDPLRQCRCAHIADLVRPHAVSPPPAQRQRREHSIGGRGLSEAAHFSSSRDGQSSSPAASAVAPSSPSSLHSKLQKQARTYVSTRRMAGKQAHYQIAESKGTCLSLATSARTPATPIRLPPQLQARREQMMSLGRAWAANGPSTRAYSRVARAGQWIKPSARALAPASLIRLEETLAMPQSGRSRSGIAKAQQVLGQHRQGQAGAGAGAAETRAGGTGAAGAGAAGTGAGRTGVTGAGGGGGERDGDGGKVVPKGLAPES